MNLRDLGYLIAIDELGSFARAAEHCYVSQPTLSAQIKKLESFLGVTLVERLPRGAVLTEGGRAVVAHARTIHSEIIQIKEAAAFYGGSFSGMLKLGMIPTVAPYLLPLIVKPLRKRFCALSLEFYEEQTYKLLEKIHSGELDLLVLALPLEEELTQLQIDPLYDEFFRLAVNTSHALANRKKVNHRALASQPLALLEEGHCLRAHALDVCERASAVVEERYTATSLETLRYMVEANEVATLMPALATAFGDPSQALQSSVRYIPFTRPEPRRMIGLVYRKRSYQGALFQEMGEVIRTSVQNCGGIKIYS